jgi:predicted nucleic acid-binding protein
VPDGLFGSVAYIDEIVSLGGLYAEAFELARVHRRSAYDMFYIALAARESALLLTVDKGMAQLAADRGITVL